MELCSWKVHPMSFERFLSYCFSLLFSSLSIHELFSPPNIVFGNHERLQWEYHNEEVSFHRSNYMKLDSLLNFEFLKNNSREMSRLLFPISVSILIYDCNKQLGIILTLPIGKWRRALGLLLRMVARN